MQKQNKKKRKYSIFQICFGFMVVIFFAIAAKYYFGNQGKLEAIHQESSLLEKKLNYLEEEQQALKELQALKGSPEYVEKIARDKLDMLKADEIIFKTTK